MQRRAWSRTPARRRAGTAAAIGAVSQRCRPSTNSRREEQDQNQPPTHRPHQASGSADERYGASRVILHFGAHGCTPPITGSRLLVNVALSNSVRMGAADAEEALRLNTIRNGRWPAVPNARAGDDRQRPIAGQAIGEGQRDIRFGRSCRLIGEAFDHGCRAVFLGHRRTCRPICRIADRSTERSSGRNTGDREGERPAWPSRGNPASRHIHRPLIDDQHESPPAPAR